MVFEVPDQEAKHYAEGVRRGGTLLAVTAANSLADRAEDVLLLPRGRRSATAENTMATAGVEQFQSHFGTVEYH
jgi:hypothetical protein